MLRTKSKVLLVLFLIMIFITSCCYATSDAAITTETDTTTTPEESTHTHEEPSWTNSDLFVCEDTVNISNVVDGNAFIIGKNVTISGEIGGDLFVLADKLNIEGGYIYSSIFACANEITINGVVYDVYAICNTFNLESNGFIYRDLKITSANLNINGMIRRNAFISSENINFAESTQPLIGGSLNYSSKSEISIPENIVTGEVNYTPISIKNDTNTNVVGIILSYALDLIRTLISTFVITLVLLWLTPKFIERVGNIKVSKSFAALGIGFATPIAFVLASILLIISIIGVDIFAHLISSFTLLVYIGFSITSIFFGKLFTKLLKIEGKVKFVLFTLVSSIILWVLSQIPFVGGLFGIITCLFGIGLTLVNIFVKNEKVKEVETTEVEVKE